MSPNLDIALTQEAIDPAALLTATGPNTGASFLFTGHVRDEENGESIGGLIYESYDPMAIREMHRLAEEIARDQPVQNVVIRHRTGSIRVGEIAIAIVAHGRHRREALTFVEEFLNRLKQDVPIWKTGILPRN